MLALLFIGAVAFVIYAQFFDNKKQNPSSMSRSELHKEMRKRLKKSLIDEIENNPDIKEFRNTEVETMLILNLISNFHEASLKNFIEHRLSMGLTEQEAINMVKTVTNEVMDIYISNAKQFHIK
jgi:hypothetical protein